MERVSRFLPRALKLKVNGDKSAVARPWERKFLGFPCTAGRRPKRRLAPQALGRGKARSRQTTTRTRGISLAGLLREVSPSLGGWRNYLGFCQARSSLTELEAWIGRRFRGLPWKQGGRRRYRELRKRGVSRELAWHTPKAAHGPGRLSRRPALSLALPAASCDSQGLPRLAGALLRHEVASCTTERPHERMIQS